MGLSKKDNDRVMNEVMRRLEEDNSTLVNIELITADVMHEMRLIDDIGLHERIIEMTPFTSVERKVFEEDLMDAIDEDIQLYIDIDKPSRDDRAFYWIQVVNDVKEMIEHIEAVDASYFNYVMKKVEDACTKGLGL